MMVVSGSRHGPSATEKEHTVHCNTQKEQRNPDHIFKWNVQIESPDNIGQSYCYDDAATNPEEQEKGGIAEVPGTCMIPSAEEPAGEKQPGINRSRTQEEDENFSATTTRQVGHDHPDHGNANQYRQTNSQSQTELP